MRSRQKRSLVGLRIHAEGSISATRLDLDHWMRSLPQHSRDGEGQLVCGSRPYNLGHAERYVRRFEGTVRATVTIMDQDLPGRTKLSDELAERHQRGGHDSSGGNAVVRKWTSECCSRRMLDGIYASG
jgi:hypothetical protein